MGTEMREKPQKYITPDGGYYDPVTSFTKEKAPGYKIGTGQRGNDSMVKNASQVPGAGSYNINDNSGKKYNFHMGQKL